MYTYAAKVWDLSIVQGPFSVAHAQPLRFVFFIACIAANMQTLPAPRGAKDACLYAHAWRENQVDTLECSKCVKTLAAGGQLQAPSRSGVTVEPPEKEQRDRAPLVQYSVRGVYRTPLTHPSAATVPRLTPSRLRPRDEDCSGCAAGRRVGPPRHRPASVCVGVRSPLTR